MLPIFLNLKRQLYIVCYLGLISILSGCGAGFFGEGEDRVYLSGKRLSIMGLERKLSPDDQLAQIKVALPKPENNVAWPQPGGNAMHSMQHPFARPEVHLSWTTDIGAGSNDETSLLASPLVHEGYVFTLDSQGLVSSFNEKTGAIIWRLDTRSKEDFEAVYNGGITSGNGLIFIALGNGEVIAVDEKSGKQKWRVKALGPIRSPPTYSNGRVFLVTIDNKTEALSATSGDRLWLHSGVPEVAGLLGGASPAVKGNVVIVPYSSGEIYALKAETGRVFWVDNMSRMRRTNAAASISDIGGNPVIDGNIVFAINHSGRLTALDFKSGTRIWERNIAGSNTPWVAGKYLFLVSNSGKVICLTKLDGRIKWITPLPAFESPDDREGAIYYVGPTLVGDRLVISSSIGEIYSLSPYSGRVLGKLEWGNQIFIPPIVANGTILILNDRGKLLALR